MHDAACNATLATVSTIIPEWMSTASPYQVEVYDGAIIQYFTHVGRASNRTLATVFTSQATFTWFTDTGTPATMDDVPATGTNGLPVSALFMPDDRPDAIGALPISRVAHHPLADPFTLEPLFRAPVQGKIVGYTTANDPQVIEAMYTFTSGYGYGVCLRTETDIPVLPAVSARLIQPGQEDRVVCLAAHEDDARHALLATSVRSGQPSPVLQACFTLGADDNPFTQLETAIDQVNQERARLQRIAHIAAGCSSFSPGELVATMTQLGATPKQVAKLFTTP